MAGLRWLASLWQVWGAKWKQLTVQQDLTDDAGKDMIEQTTNMESKRVILIQASVRGNDAHGSGAYLASRDGGKDVHRGVDFACSEGNIVVSPLAGRVVKVGYMYSDGIGAWNDIEDPFRYIDIIESKSEYRFRFGYVRPVHEVGDTIRRGAGIGFVQNIARRYIGITNHIHVEARDPEGKVVDPEQALMRC